jgi:hypothetical protein
MYEMRPKREQDRLPDMMGHGTADAHMKNPFEFHETIGTIQDS